MILQILKIPRPLWVVHILFLLTSCQKEELLAAKVKKAESQASEAKAVIQLLQKKHHELNQEIKSLQGKLETNRRNQVDPGKSRVAAARRTYLESLLTQVNSQTQALVKEKAEYEQKYPPQQ
jgi:chromosome segregation ATPase